MLVSIALLAILQLLARHFLPSHGWTHYVFCLETLLVVAFAFSWLTKGAALAEGLAQPLTRVLAKFL